MEFFDIYDSHRQLTGRKAPRGTALGQGDYRLVVHICIFNSQGQMLIQRRQPFKRGWSGYWDFTVGGMVSAGEQSQQAAARELMEEIGYDAGTRVYNAPPVITICAEHVFDDYYVLVDDGITISELRLQPEEVAEVRWAGIAEIFAMIDAGEFIPYHYELLELLFAVPGKIFAGSRRRI